MLINEKNTQLLGNLKRIVNSATQVFLKCKLLAKGLLFVNKINTYAVKP